MTIKDGEWIVNLNPSSHPREVMIELTTACNYNCIFCFRRMTDEPLNGFMNELTYKKLMEQAYHADVEKLSFTGWGETFVHPKAIEFIKKAKERGFEILIASNGYLLEKYAKELVNLGIDELYVSVDSISSELYKMLRIGGNLSSVTKGLLKVKEIKTENGSRKPDITVQMTLNRYNVKDLPKLPDYGIKVGASKAVVSLMLPLSREMEKSMACYADEKCVKIVEKMKEVVKDLVPYITVILPNTTTVSERRCPFISKSATYVRWDGYVAPCIYYAHNWKHAFQGILREIKAVLFGNINNKDLLSIWRDPGYSSFRFRAYFFRMPSCLDCPIRDYCSLTLSNESDCWGNSPTCAACPFSHDMVRCPL